MHAFYSVMGGMLGTLCRLIPSIGIALILWAFLLQLIALPLSLKQLKNRRILKILYPQIVSLSKKQSDPKLFRQELAKLYHLHGYVPLGGILHLALQVLFLIGLYGALCAPAQFIPGSSNIYHFLWASDLSVSSRTLIETYGFLSLPALASLVFPIFAVFTLSFQLKRIEPINPLQKRKADLILYLFLFIAAVLCPQGLSLYFIAQGLLNAFILTVLDEIMERSLFKQKA